MFGIDKININFSFSPFFFFAGLILIAGYTFYSYKYTVPQVNTPFRLLLVSIRSLALLIMLFIAFEPILTLTRKTVNEPVNLIFADNSKSMQINDGHGRKEAEIAFLRQIGHGDLKKYAEIYSFGSKVNKISPDSLEKFSFDEPSTNFAKLFNSIKPEEKNISAIVVVSDGVVTDGSSPVYQAEKLGVPVFSVVLGDTARKNNIEIKKVLFNEYIYAGTPTTINCAVASSGFKDKSVDVNLLEDNRKIATETVRLNDNGIVNVNFTYTAKSAGEKKLAVSVEALNGEFTAADNKKTFYLNVLNNKLNTLLLAGSPSADLSFIKNSLSEDENFKVSSLTQISAGKFLENENQGRLLDSANILYLIGFPSSNTPEALLTRVMHEIRDKDKPFVIVLSASTDFTKLKILQSELPFNIGRILPGFSDAQPNIGPDELQNPLLQNNAQNILNAWNNLPPVPKYNTELTAKPESEVLSKTKINNIPLNQPLILSRRLGNKRAIAVLAKDIWRWKLQTAEKKSDLFDRLMLSSVKWLNTKEDQKTVTIKTTKKVYSMGETVEFAAQVYNEAFNPVDDAEITVNVKSPKEDFAVNMNSLGNGLYEGTLATSVPGDYTFSGSAKSGNKIIGRDSGKFSMGDVDIEFINPGTDKELLTLLAAQTGGQVFYEKDYSKLFRLLKELNTERSKEKINKSEITIWSNEWMLIFVISLFALEWFLRKRSGML